MRFHKFSAVFALTLFVFLSFTSSASIVAPLNYTDAQAATVKEVISKLMSRHFRVMKVDDELSQRFLENYLETLDPARMFFFGKDIEGFERNANKFDDYFKAGNLAPGFEIYHTYRQRVVSRLENVLEVLENQEVIFEFESKDEILLDRKDQPWPNTQAEADKLWFKRLKLSLLNLKLAGKDIAEARKTLTKRYKNQLNRVQQQDSTDVFETMVNSLTMLYDPHTNYWSERTNENFTISMSLSLEGIGAVLKSEDEFTEVVRLVAGGPAHRQGQLKVADRIVGVGQGDDGEVVDVVGWRLDEVVNLIRGPKNTVVRLEVLPNEAAVNTQAKVIRISRGEVKLEDQAAQSAVMELAEGDKIYKIGVIHVPTFYLDFEAYSNRDPNFRSSTRDVARLLGELEKQKVDGIVLDLRNNGGGSLHEAAMMTDLFIDQGPVVQIRSIEDRINRHNRSLSKARYRGPLVVLVNRLSASASEIFAGAIQDYQRGLIVGSQSFGKGTVQSVTPLREGALKITESKFYRVSGDSTQHRGVIPDIQLPVLIDSEEVGESTYDNALPWDQIHAVPHSKYFDFASIIPMLKNLHDTRAAKDPDFEFINDQIDMMVENKKRKTISLNEKERITEKDNLEQQAMDIENKRRRAKKQEPYKTLAEFRKSESDEDENANLEPELTKIDVDGDTLLLESGNILIDMVRLLNQNTPRQVSAHFMPNPKKRH